MKLSVLSTSKSKKEDIVLSDAFVKDYNESLVHQAVVTYLAGMRQGSHKQKNRPRRPMNAIMWYTYAKYGF